MTTQTRRSTDHEIEQGGYGLAYMGCLVASWLLIASLALVVGFFARLGFNIAGALLS